jgi:hypothetical protein
MLCHGGAKRRAKFELSASLNVIFISASSDGSASISGNRSWKFKEVNVPDGWLNVPDGLPMCHWLHGYWKIKALIYIYIYIHTHIYNTRTHTHVSGVAIMINV